MHKVSWNIAGILLALLALPALAADWGSYTNKRYGASASIPPGFKEMGVEAANGEGQTFRALPGHAILVIYGADVTEGSFEKHVEARIAFDQSYYGWKINDKSVTPSWASYTAAGGQRALAIRILSSCKGRQSVTARLEYDRGSETGNYVSKVLASLKAESGRGC